MAINIFNIFRKINEDDTAKETRNLMISKTVVATRKVRAGAVVEMGVEESIMYDIMHDKAIVLLLVIDKAEYKKIEQEQMNQGENVQRSVATNPSSEINS